MASLWAVPYENTKTSHIGFSKLDTLPFGTITHHSLFPQRLPVPRFACTPHLIHLHTHPHSHSPSGVSSLRAAAAAAAGLDHPRRAGVQNRKSSVPSLSHLEDLA